MRGRTNRSTKKKKKNPRNKLANVCAPITCGNNHSVHNPVMVGGGVHCVAKSIFPSDKIFFDKDLIAVHCVLAQELGWFLIKLDQSFYICRKHIPSVVAAVYNLC